MPHTEAIHATTIRNYWARERDREIARRHEQLTRQAATISDLLSDNEITGEMILERAEKIEGDAE